MRTRQSQDPAIQLPPEVVAAGPVAVHNGYLRLRDELQLQIRRIDGDRIRTSQALASNLTAAERTMHEGRLAALDARVAVINARAAMVEAEIARAASAMQAGQGTAEVGVAAGPPPGAAGIARFPEELIAIPALVVVFIGFPLALAYARRIWRRAGEVGSEIPKAILDRLDHLDRNVDAIAVEVERIGESQRYLAKSLGAGSAERIDVVPAGERERAR